MKDNFDHLSDAELESIIAEGTQDKKSSRGFSDYLGIGTRGALQGIGTIPDLLALPSNIALTVGGKEPLPSVSQALGKGFDYLTDNQFTPETLGEKALGTAAEFISGGGGIAKAGATRASQFAKKYLAPQTAKEYQALAGAGAGLEVGKELAPDSALSPFLASIAGGLAPGIAKGTAKSLVNPFSVNSEKVKAFQQAELNPTLADVTDSRFIRGAQNILAETPGAGGIISNSIKATIDKIAKYGEGLTQVEGGELAQRGLRSYQKRGSELAGKLQQKMSSYITPSEGIAIGKTLEAINKKPQFSTPEAQKQFASSAVGKEYGKLSNIAARNEGKVPYEDLVYFRQQIDDQINNFGLMGFNKEQGALKNLRTQIQGDIGNNFKQKGEQAFKAFERHNKFYTQFARKNEDVINDLIKDKTATETFKSIVNDLRVDAKKADTVLKTLKPDQKQVFSQSLVRELGMSPQNEFNPSYLATNFKKLEPKAQEVTLASFSPHTRKQFRATIDAIDNMKGTKASGNPSGTFNQGLKLGAIGGALTNPVQTGSLLLLGVGSAKLMTNPKFINWLAQGSRLATPKQEASHIGKLGLIAKSSPEIAVDIERYLQGIEQTQSFDHVSDEELQKIITEEEQGNLQ